MDLKEAIERVKTAAESAHSSFHAGRHEDAENYLFEVEKVVVEYLRMTATPAGDVTETATSETETEQSEETPEKAAGDRVQPGAVLPDVAGQQKALDQAGQ